MLDSIRKIFDFASSGLAVSEELLTLVKASRGRKRVLFEELKANQDLCVMVLEEGTEPMKIIPELSTAQYDALSRGGFNFDSIKRARIAGNLNLRQSDLGSFIGKSTSELIEDIYDKVKELERRHRLDKDNPRIDWRRRIINVYKRMVLLVDHLRA